MGQQTHLVQRGSHPASGVGGRESRHHQRQRHIVVHATVKEQPVVLKHHSETSAITRHHARPDLAGRLTIYADVSATGSIQQQ